MKCKLFLGAITAICLSLFAFGTIAYFTAEDVAHNVITSGEIDIEILEWANNDKNISFPNDGVIGVMPGTKVTKIVEIENTGANAAYIRIKVEKEIILSDGIEDEPNLGLMTLDFDEINWEYGKDGFYYYKKPLNAGEVTPSLFTTVSFDTNMDNRYQNSTAKVVVKAYATQVANNGDSAMSASGWPQE